LIDSATGKKRPHQQKKASTGAARATDSSATMMGSAARKKKPGQRKKASTAAAHAADASANLICDGTSKNNSGPKTKASMDALAQAIALQRDDVSPITKVVFEKSLLHLHLQRDEEKDDAGNMFSDSTSDEFSESSAANISISGAQSSEGETINGEELRFDDDLHFGDEAGSEEASDVEYQCEKALAQSTEFEDEADPVLNDKLQEDWDYVPLEESEVPQALHYNRYLNKIFVSGGVEINHLPKLNSIMGHERIELKLFFLFLTKSFFGAVHKWTSLRLNASHQSRVKYLKTVLRPVLCIH
jgi:hypothetical protein